MKKKRICICAAQVPFIRGGAESMVQSLYDEIKKRGFDVELINIPFKWYPYNDMINSVMMWRMMNLNESLALNEKIDLVIATKFPSYAIKHPNKVLWLMHQFRQVYDLYDNEQVGYKNLKDGDKIKKSVVEIDNITIKESKEIFTISKNVSNRLEKYNDIKAKHLYHPPKHVGKYFNNEYGNYILSIGRLDPLKRIDLLIRALKYTDSGVKAIIGGEGPIKGELQKLAIQEGVSDKVVFLGYVGDEEMLKLYSNCLAVYFAPFDEDYGYITLEAFLSKKPIITTDDSGGVLEFVKNEHTGFVCEKSSEEIGLCINRLFAQKLLSKEIGENAFDTVKDINWNYVIDNLTRNI